MGGIVHCLDVDQEQIDQRNQAARRPPRVAARFVSIAVWIPWRRQSSRISRVNSACTSGSPPEIVTPPVESVERTIGEHFGNDRFRSAQFRRHAPAISRSTYRRTRRRPRNDRDDRRAPVPSKLVGLLRGTRSATGLTADAAFGEDLDFRLPTIGLGIMTPRAAHLAAFQEHRCANAGPVVNREPLDVGNDSAGHRGSLHCRSLLESSRPLMPCSVRIAGGNVTLTPSFAETDGGIEDLLRVAAHCRAGTADGTRFCRLQRPQEMGGPVGHVRSRVSVA